MSIIPKDSSSLPNSEKDASSPKKNELILLMKSAPVNTKIAAAKPLMLSTIPSSIDDAPSINGFRFAIKLDRSVAISGKPEDNPPVNPSTIFPKNDPIA